MWLNWWSYDEELSWLICMVECNHECSYEVDRRIREREVTLQAEDGTMKGHKPRNAGSDMNFISVQLCPTLPPHELQHARPPCPSATPGVHPNPCPSSRWCHPASHLILCHPLLLLSPVFPSIRVFPNESALRIRWPKYWSSSFNISPSSEHPGLISFRMDWVGLLAVQGTLKSLLQHHSSKASILRRSAFFIVQPSHAYLTTGKIIALTRQTFVDKVMSLLFNMLSRLVITFFPRSKCLLILRLQSPSAVILEPPKNKVRHCFHCFPI